MFNKVRLLLKMQNEKICHNQSDFKRCFFYANKITIFLFLMICFGKTGIAAEEEIKRPQKTVFITGAAGFIGSNFLQFMFDKYPEYRFVVLDALTYAGSLDNIPEYIKESKRFKFVHGSITDYPLVEEMMSSANYVVHFAAESHVTKSITESDVFFDTNIIGTLSLIKALLKYPRTVERFIHISTSEVYGTAEYDPMDEKHPLNPRSPYAASKAAADRLVYAYSCTYDIPVVIIRPFNNYGPKQHIEKMIPRFIVSAMNKQPLEIHGTGEQVRDWIYTQDVSIALDRVLHLPDFSRIKNQEINISSCNVLSTLEIAKLILKHFNLPESSYLNFIENRPGQVMRHSASHQKALELLDWKSTIDMKKGLEMTIQWYIDHPSFGIEKDKELISDKSLSLK